MGWRDFRAIDHPDSGNIVTVACEAFLYLSVSSETGAWNEALDVLMAIKAYLDGATGRVAQAADLRLLAQILKERPVKQDKIQDWFQDIYG